MLGTEDRVELQRVFMSSYRVSIAELNLSLFVEITVCMGLFAECSGLKYGVLGCRIIESPESN